MAERSSEEARRRRLSRRDLLKALPAAGVVAGGAALIGRGTAASTHRSGTCRVCMGHCGIRGKIGGDRLLRVEGDPAAKTGGFICLHGLAIREIVHSPARVRRPLKKVGGSFEEISWRQAWDEIAERLQAVRQEFGPQALAVQAGWGLVAHPMQQFLLRFCQTFGTPNFATVESFCQAGVRMGQALTVGSWCRADANRSRTLVLWGANPSVSQPVWARVVGAVTPSGRNLVVIDPVRTEFAARATMHLPIRPGTDGALALGLMHVIVEQGWHDRSYIDRFTLGFEPLRGLIAQYPPARVAEITSIRPQEIHRAARLIAQAGPTSMWMGLGIEHHDNAGQTVRAITSLAAICGDVDVPGGNLPLTKARSRVDGKPLPSIMRLSTPHPVPPPVDVAPIGYDEYPLFEMFNRQAQGNLFATAILEDRPYPLRAMILFASNALVTSPGSERLRRAAGKLSLLVSVDPFLTASGELADYVLPATTFVEGPAPKEGQALVDRPMVEAQHESRSDWEILAGLAGALGMESYFPWATLEEALAAPREPYMKARRTILAEGSQATARPRFPSASGKIEIYSRTLERFGHDPLPVWKEPAESPRRVGEEFPFVLVSGPRTRAYVNSQFRQIPSVRAKMPEPLAEVHPEAARKAGIRDGETVAVVSPHGRIVLRARVTLRVQPDSVVIQAGWAEANANLLTSDAPLDPITGFPAFRSGVCRLESLGVTS